MAVVTVTITVDDSIVTEALQCFLLRNPMPLDTEGNPIYANNVAWIQAWVKQRIIDECVSGKVYQLEAARTELEQTQLNLFRTLIT